MKRVLILIFATCMLPAMERVREKGESLRSLSSLINIATEKTVVYPNTWQSDNQHGYAAFNETQFINVYGNALAQLINAQTGEIDGINLPLGGFIESSFPGQDSTYLLSTFSNVDRACLVEAFGKTYKIGESLPEFSELVRWRNIFILKGPDERVYVYNPKTGVAGELEDLFGCEGLKVKDDYVMGFYEWDFRYEIKIINLNNLERTKLKIKSILELEIDDYFLIGNKVIVVDDSALSVWDLKSKKHEKSVITFDSPMVSPICYKNNIITASGCMIKVYNANLDMIQEFSVNDKQFRNKEYFIVKLWITGEYLCAQIIADPDCAQQEKKSASWVVRWKLETGQRSRVVRKKQVNKNLVVPSASLTKRTKSVNKGKEPIRISAKLKQKTPKQGRKEQGTKEADQMSPIKRQQSSVDNTAPISQGLRHNLFQQILQRRSSLEGNKLKSIHPEPTEKKKTDEGLISLFNKAFEKYFDPKNPPSDAA